MRPGRTTIGAGGAIVMQSDPEDEFDEILLKARAPMAAIAAGGHRHATPPRPGASSWSRRAEAARGAMSVRAATADDAAAVADAVEALLIELGGERPSATALREAARRLAENPTRARKRGRDLAERPLEGAGSPTPTSSR